MFTVIMCDKHIINDCRHKYHMYLKPFLEKDNFAFCPWNSQADTLDDALPELREIIKYKKEWRAVIVNDSSTWGFDSINKLNPFNFVNATGKDYKFSSFESVLNFRSREAELADLAMSNPLTKLSLWLCGSPIRTQPELCYADNLREFSLIEDDKSYFEFLESTGLSSYEVEFDYSRDLKYRKLSEQFEPEGELFNSPTSVVALSQRAKNVDLELKDAAWIDHTEFDYSRFYMDNLYPEKLRYLLYDISYIKGQKNESMYFNFLSALLLFSTNDCPMGVLRAERVYRYDIQIDPACIRDLCRNYNSKLAATITKIDDISRRLNEKEKQPLDKDLVRECFESDIEIPIEVVTDESRDSLRADYKTIGLSKDCPTDEEEKWDNQYRSISKYFIRFLREPRRAVKTATKEKFRNSNKIDDDRVSRLSEYQKEDIMYVLEEEEQNMVSTSTTQLFNTVRYTKQMTESDKEIKREISHRMTRKKTLIVCIVALAAYLFGFTPLVISNLNTMKSLNCSLIITGILMGAFLVVGFVYLFILRYQLVSKIKNFNTVMSNVLMEIDRGVKEFSKYLSHACNVAREFSVLNLTDTAFKRKQRILKNHKRIIHDRINEVNSLFATYFDEEGIVISYDAEPFKYDFTEAQEFEYIMPYAPVNRQIDFLQQGNVINTPVDYIRSATVRREELYD